jgi:hypothetical protein
MAELTAGPREDGQLSIAPVGSLVLFRLRFPAGGRSSGVTPLPGGRLDHDASRLNQSRRMNVIDSKELSMLFFREVVSTFRQRALPGSSISQGRRFMGAPTGSVVSHHAPADEGEPFRIRPRPLPSAVRSAAQIRQQRLPTGCAAAINDDYEAEMPSRLRQSLPRGCVRAHDRR